MTAVLLFSLYLLALTFFLGLDILSRVPPTLYALVIAGLGGLGAVAVAGALHIGAWGDPGGRAPTLAAVLAGVAAGGGLVAMRRLIRAARPRDRRK